MIKFTRLGLANHFFPLDFQNALYRIMLGDTIESRKRNV